MMRPARFRTHRHHGETVKISTGIMEWEPRLQCARVVCVGVCLHTRACAPATVWASESIFLLLCLCLPAINRLGVLDQTHAGFFQALTWLFCICLSSPLLSSPLPSVLSSPLSALHHTVFTTSFLFMWMVNAHEFMDFCTGGLSSEGDQKWFHSLLCGIRARGGTGWELKALDNCFVLVHSPPQREGSTWNKAQWPHVWNICEQNNTCSASCCEFALLYMSNCY